MSETNTPRPAPMLTDHSGDRPAAPTPREQGFQQRLTTVRDDALALTALLREAGIAFDYNHEALFADSLVYLLATVERLEAAEQAKAGRGDIRQSSESAAGRVTRPTAPVPPSPPTKDEAQRWIGVGGEGARPQPPHRRAGRGQEAAVKLRQWVVAGHWCEREAERWAHVLPLRGELHVDPATGVLHHLTLNELALLAYLYSEGAPR